MPYSHRVIEAYDPRSQPSLHIRLTCILAQLRRHDMVASLPVSMDESQSLNGVMGLAYQELRS